MHSNLLKGYHLMEDHNMAHNNYPQNPGAWRTAIKANLTGRVRINLKKLDQIDCFERYRNIEQFRFDFGQNLVSLHGATLPPLKRNKE